MAVEQALAQIEADAVLYHSFVHGAAGYVVTEGGSILNMALQAYRSDQKVLQLSIFNPRGAWVTGAVYAFRDIVTESGVNYMVLTGHTAGTFATDLAAGRLAIHQDPTAAILQAALARELEGEGVDFVARAKKNVATVDDLDSTPPGTHENVYARCFETIGDGGFGEFEWVGSSIATPVRGMIHQVTGVATGRWIRQYEYLTPDMSGGILTAGPEIQLLPKTYTLDEAKTFTDSVYKIAGTLAVNTVAGSATSSASEIDAGAYAISFGSAKTSFGLYLSGFLLNYSGAGTALTVDDFINTTIKGVFIDCNAMGAIGVALTGSSFFSVVDNSTIQRFTDIGLLVDTIGTKTVIRDCNIGSSTGSNANYAVEIRDEGTSIYDGQIDIDRNDNLGAGVFFNNTSGAIIYGGLVHGTLFEKDLGVRIDGTTHGFSSVVLKNTRHTLGSGQRGVEFLRAYDCKMEDPSVYGPTGGTLVTWGANSIRCGLVGGYNACRSINVVHGSAQYAYKVCNERIAYSERANITTYANLTTTVNDCIGLGKTVHNGTSWDKFIDTILDDSFTSITPPKAVGSVRITSASGGGEYILANYNVTTGVTTELVTGGGCQISTTNGALNGTTGTDGYLTLRSYSTDGKIYIENRRANARTLTVVFE